MTSYTIFILQCMLFGWLKQDETEWTCNKLCEMSNAYKISARKYEVKRSLGTTNVYVRIKIQFWCKNEIQHKKIHTRKKKCFIPYTRICCLYDVNCFAAGMLLHQSYYTVFLHSKVWFTCLIINFLKITGWTERHKYYITNTFQSKVLFV